MNRQPDSSLLATNVLQIQLYGNLCQEHRADKIIVPDPPKFHFLCHNYKTDCHKLDRRENKINKTNYEK